MAGRGIPDGFYEVEELLGMRNTSKGREFLVKWKNYSHKWNTWEPEANLYCSALIKEYLRQQNAHSELKVGASSLQDTKNPNLTKRPFVQIRDYFRPRIHVSKEESRRNSVEKFLQMMNSNPRDAPITLENVIDDTLPPAHFCGITASIYGEGVPRPDPSFLIGCECGQQNCSTSSSCFCINQNPDGRPTYSATGRLLLTEGLIYECNSQCSCPPTCSNRVIQNGRQISLCIARFPEPKGWGVKTNVDIDKGTFIDLYLGEVITADEAQKRFTAGTDQGEAHYLFDLDFNCEENMEPEFTVDAYTFGNVTHFINHSCEPNLQVHPCFLDTWDPRLHQLAFFSKRDIKTGEELCFDYLGGAAATKDCRIECHCGTPKCRGFVY